LGNVLQAGLGAVGLYRADPGGYPAAERAHKHEEILEALRSLGASASKPVSAAGANACTYASPFDTNGCIMEVPAPACSSPDREGVPEAVPMSAALKDSSSSAGIIKESLEVDPSAFTSFITRAPTTCSTDCLPQQGMAVPVFVASSSLTLTECVLDTNNVHVAAVPLSFMGEFSAVLAPTAYTPTLQVPIHRPMPWPSFRCIHAHSV
jgi:hypothetical protein